jgi:ankyrin repeat protein
VQNDAGRTPVEEALVKGHDDVVQLLLGYGTGV